MEKGHKRILWCNVPKVPNTVQHDTLIYFQCDHRQKIKEWPFGLEFDHNYWILGTKEIKWMSGKMMNEYFNFASNHSWISRFVIPIPLVYTEQGFSSFI